MSSKLSLGSRSALVTRTGSDFLSRFSNCHLEFGKIAAVAAVVVVAAVVIVVAAVVAGIIRTRTLCDQYTGPDTTSEKGGGLDAGYHFIEKSGFFRMWFSSIIHGIVAK